MVPYMRCQVHPRLLYFIFIFIHYVYEYINRGKVTIFFLYKQIFLSKNLNYSDYRQILHIFPQNVSFFTHP